MTTAAPAEVVIPAAPIAEALTAAAQEAAAPTMEVPEEAAIPAAVQEAAPIVAVQEAVTPAAAAEVTWMWSGHRICCSPAHVIDIYILRISPHFPVGYIPHRLRLRPMWTAPWAEADRENYGKESVTVTIGE